MRIEEMSIDDLSSHGLSKYTNLHNDQEVWANSNKAMFVLRYIKDCEDLDKLRTIHRMSDNKISFETAYIEFMEDKE